MALASQRWGVGMRGWSCPQPTGKPSLPYKACKESLFQKALPNPLGTLADLSLQDTISFICFPHLACDTKGMEMCGPMCVHPCVQVH